MIAVDADVVFCATVSVCGVPGGVPIAAAVRFSVTPWIAVVTVLLELVAVVPKIENAADEALEHDTRRADGEVTASLVHSS